MKRFISVILCLILLLLCGCSQPTKVEEEGNAPEPPAEEEPSEKPEENQGDVTPIQTLEPSDNKTVVTEKDAPTVYWTMDVAYHLETCPELSKKENTQVTWKMVKEVGLRQCPVCNPPQYEDYIDIE